jgi:hypothetical protein
MTTHRLEIHHPSWPQPAHMPYCSTEDEGIICHDIPPGAIQPAWHQFEAVRTRRELVGIAGRVDDVVSISRDFHGCQFRPPARCAEAAVHAARQMP